MNNYFNLKTIINRNVLYLQQRVDNGILVNTPPPSYSLIVNQLHNKLILLKR